MLRRLVGMLLRRGVETAIRETANVAAAATTETFRQIFNVSFPVTIYVRASQCSVTIRKLPGRRVELQASLQASFGWEFVTDQDEAGVYIVARRKPIVGALSGASFTLLVPPEANLVFHLTPGSLHLLDIDGKLNLPAEVQADQPPLPPARHSSRAT